jgi:hypothetical protein
MRPGIEDNAVPRAVDAGRRGDLVRLRRDLLEQAAAGPGERGQIRVVLFRYDKHVGRRLRADVAERYRTGTLQHARRRRLTRRDTAEEAVSHATILTCSASARLPTYMVALLRILGESLVRAAKASVAAPRRLVVVIRG